MHSRTELSKPTEENNWKPAPGLGKLWCNGIPMRVSGVSEVYGAH